MVENLEAEKLNEIKKNDDYQENQNKFELENNSRQVEYINIFWDEWRML